MKTSESISKLAPALLKAQSAITFAVKNENNPFFKNKYADLPKVIDAVKSALNDAGIVFLQTPSPSEDNKLHLTTRLLHESGEWIEDTAVTPLVKQDPQGFGSAVTYLRRYCLASIIGLYQDDDDGNGTIEKPKVKSKCIDKPVLAYNLENLIEAIQFTSTIEELSSVYKSAYITVSSASKNGTGKPGDLEKVVKVYNNRKDVLNEQSNGII
jgi:hypothetical protein